MAFFKTMGGREFTIAAGKFSRLVDALRLDMLSPPLTNRDYMKRTAGLIKDLYGETVPAETEKDFIETLLRLGVIQQINGEGK